MLIHPLRVVDIWVTVNNLPLAQCRFSIWEENRNNQDLFVIRICYLAKHFIFVLQTEDNQKEILE